MVTPTVSEGHARTGEAPVGIAALRPIGRREVPSTKRRLDGSICCPIRDGAGRRHEMVVVIVPATTRGERVRQGRGRPTKPVAFV